MMLKMKKKLGEESMTSAEEFKVFVRWDVPGEVGEDEEGSFEWVPLREAFAGMTAGDVFQVFLPGADDPLSSSPEAEEVWVWQRTDEETGEDEVFWDALGPFTKKDVARLSRLKYPHYIDVDDEELVHGLQVYFRELRKLHKKAKESGGRASDERRPGVR